MNKQNLWFLSTRLCWKRLGAIAFLGLTSLAITAPRAEALRIELDFADLSPPPLSIFGSDALSLGVGDTDVALPGGNLVNVLPLTSLLDTAVGGGDVFDIFRSAADCWEQAITDDFVLTLNIGVAQLSPFKRYYSTTAAFDGVLALHILNAGQEIYLADGTSVFRETEGTILVNSDDRLSFFLDPTPRMSEEYEEFSNTDEDLGGGVVNVGRGAFANQFDASGFDLFTVALHEIGHALGLSRVNPAAIAEVQGDSVINVRSPLPFAGTQIPTTFIEDGDVHLDPDSFSSFFAPPVGFPTLNSGQRRLLSGIDVLAVAEISKYQQVNLDPCNLCDNPPPQSVPEPSTLFALSAIAGTLVASRKRLGAKLLPNSEKIAYSNFQVGRPQ